MLTIFSTWNLMRFLRLGIGLYAVAETVRTGDLIYLLPGGILLLQAFFNVGCMGGSCAPTTRFEPAKDVSNEPVDFKEIR
ncbi:MAG: hypothetical protein IPL65_19535 [Lewinellaceae bacterium]|nr:hypothetical protein [Lewinellaceae bacterium]